MGVNWTRDQSQVIESRGCNLLVSAAAGSGKTAVLVERIIRRITEGEQPADIDRLLVMTFTRAAAAEMRERIQAAIEKRLETEPDNTHLQRQAVLVQYAPITTIDSFCLHILRENFDRLDIDPAFRVADEGELLLLRADVMEELLEDYYREGGERYEEFVDCYAAGKADGGISDYIYQVYTFSQSNPWPEEWLNRCRRELDSLDEGNLDGMEWMRFLLADAARQAEDFRRELGLALETAGEEDGPAPYIPMLEEDLHSVEKLLESVGSYEEFCLSLDGISFSRLAQVRQKDGISQEKKEQVSACRSRIKKGIEKMRADYLFESPRQIMEDMRAGRNNILMLLELAEEFGRRFREKKKEKNIVDFHDLEHFALEILTDKSAEHRPGPVADEMSRQYDEILVDEYQDSNLVQETLIRCICGERFGRPNVFMVGDVKQSIYKFRLARPELFLEKYHTYTKDEGSSRKIELHQNFRSRAHVLDSVNACFYRIMTSKLGGITYNDESALHPGAEFEPREGTEELETELLLADIAQEREDVSDGDNADYTARELEAVMIAEKIRAMTEKESGISVWDKDEKCYRRACFGDIVILLRSVSGWAEEFTEILMNHGIPAFAESRTGYFNTAEVETILNLLSVIDNPAQDIPLACVLKSPFGGLTDTQLAAVTAEYKKSVGGSREKGLYPAVVRYLKNREDAEENKDDSACVRLRKILGMVDEFREKAVYLPMHELLYYIFDRTGYYRYVTALPGGQTRRANLDMLVEKAAAYEATSYRGVFHFIRYIGKLKKYNTDFGEASVINGDGNAVRIMSIHKSKGLEFPIVFVASLGKMFNRQDTRGRLLIDADLGIGTDYLDSERRIKGPTLKKNVMKRRMDLEALGEELRILYVAMTRAKEKLILTGASKNAADRIAKWSAVSLEEGRVPFTLLTEASCFLDWILMCVPGNENYIKVRLENVIQQTEREMGAQLSRDVLLAELSALARIREEEEKILEQSYGFSYPFPDDTILNTKISVSELKKQEFSVEEEAAFLPTLPVFMEKEKKEKGGVYKGTAYHRALELLPFDRMAGRGGETCVISGEEIKEYLAGFVKSGRMSEEAAKLVHPRKLAEFLESSLGQRMCTASVRGRLWREKQFVIGIPACEMGEWNSDERILIQGIIDAFFEEDEKLVLVDYKTDFAESADALVSRYRLQLDYYKRALEQITGKKVTERYIYSFRFGAIRI